MDHRTYVPILMAKAAELDALRDIDAAVRATVTPLFVPAPIPWDYQEGAAKKTLEDHLGPLAEELFKAWGHKEAFIDLIHMEGGDRIHGDIHPLTWLIEECHDMGVPLVPAVSLSKDHSYIEAVRAAHQRHRCGACFRLPIYPRLNDLVVEISELLDALHLGAGEVDLMFDMKTLPATNEAFAREQIQAGLAHLPAPREWRSVIVSGTTAPRDMSNVEQGTTLRSRAEWKIYALLMPTIDPAGRIPSFSDYAVTHPEPNEMDPRLMTISTRLRYTIPNEWLIAKGATYKSSGRTGGSSRRTSRTRGAEPTTGGINMFPVARVLVSSRYFAGPDHCAGDQWIVATAGEFTSGGSPQEWRRVETVHHLTRVTEDLATLFAS